MRFYKVNPKEHGEFYVIDGEGFTWVIWPNLQLPQSVVSLEEALKRYGFKAEAVVCKELPHLPALDRLALTVRGWNWPRIFGWQ